jgi:hypothetical protein
LTVSCLQDVELKPGHKKSHHMRLRTAVIIATKGRPQELANLLGDLERQTLPPDRILVSACEPSDVASVDVNERVHVIFGDSGSSGQRNRAWRSIRALSKSLFFLMTTSFRRDFGLSVLVRFSPNIRMSSV